MKLNLNKTIIGLGICALTAVAPAQDQNSNNAQPMSADTQVTPQHFVWEAATTDLKEIHAGELALQKSDNADVKKFAKRLIADHKKSSKKLQAIATKEGLNFPDTNSWTGNWNTNNWNGNSNSNSWSNGQNVNGIDTNNPATVSSAGIGHQNYKAGEVMELSGPNTNADNEMSASAMSLETLSGSAFDQAFAAHMVKGHEKAIQKFETASANLQDADLKKFADKTLPTLREHLQMAQDLQAKLGVNDNSGMNQNK